MLEFKHNAVLHVNILEQSFLYSDNNASSLQFLCWEKSASQLDFFKGRIRYLNWNFSWPWMIRSKIQDVTHSDWAFKIKEWYLTVCIRELSDVKVIYFLGPISFDICDPETYWRLFYKYWTWIFCLEEYLWSYLTSIHH